MMFLAVPKPFQKTSKQFSLQHYMLCSRVISNLGSFISEKLHVCTYVSCSALRLRLFSTVFDFSPLYLFTLGLGGSAPRRQKTGGLHQGSPPEWGKKLGVSLGNAAGEILGPATLPSTQVCIFLPRRRALYPYPSISILTLYVFILICNIWEMSQRQRYRIVTDMDTNMDIQICVWIWRY